TRSAARSLGGWCLTPRLRSSQRCQTPLRASRPQRGCLTPSGAQRDLARPHRRDSTNRGLGSCEMDVSVVVTVLNEEGAVEELYRRGAASLNGSDWEAVFVDDGSTDGTLAKIRAVHVQDERGRGVRFQRNIRQHPAK